MEQRKSVRLPVPISRQEGELRFGEIHLPVRLFDQSAGGFAALAQKSPAVNTGTTGLLRVGDDWYEICLIYIKQEEPQASQETSTSEEQEPCFRLGLSRICDVIDPNAKQQRWFSPVLSVYRNQIRPSNKTMAGFGLMFVFFITVMFITALYLFYNWEGESNTEAARFTKRMARENIRRNGQLNSSKGQSSVVDPGNGASQKPLASYLDELRDIIRHMPGAAAFTLPNVINQLNLTEEQQRQIQEIVDSTDETLVELEERETGQKQLYISQELLDFARNSVLEILTPEQRLRWQELTAEDSKDKQTKNTTDGK
ncbi:MAG TPA: hypothetical protein VIH42_09140 [Thermoguttaceae bacterium]